MESLLYICSVGPIEDCRVMILLRFPPARKCLVGTFESFLCGFGEFCSNLHRSDSEGVTDVVADLPPEYREVLARGYNEDAFTEAIAASAGGGSPVGRLRGSHPSHRPGCAGK